MYENSIILIKYQDVDLNISTRQISNLKISNENLIAHCHLKNAQRTFKIENIIELIIDGVVKNKGDFINEIYKNQTGCTIDEEKKIQYEQIRSFLNMDNEYFEKKYSNGIKININDIVNNFHNDIKNLLWFEDGIYANCSKNEDKYEMITIKKVIFNIATKEYEPSSISINENVIKPNDMVDLLEQYNPAPFRSLNPYKKWIYLNFLCNPYTSIDIGFLLLLHTALERHLLYSDFDSSFNVIMKLREFHKDSWYQSNSAHTLLFTSLIKNKIDMLKILIKTYENNFKSTGINDELLLSFYLIDFPLTPKFIIKTMYCFDFSNERYVEKCPELFEQNIRSILINEFGTDNLIINKFISDDMFNKLKKRKSWIFTNSSIKSEFQMPLISSNINFRNIINSILTRAHEKTKVDFKNINKRKI
jgi:hypothetical protein